MGQVTRADIKAIEYVEKKATLHESKHSKSVRKIVVKVRDIQKLVRQIADPKSKEYELTEDERQWFMSVLLSEISYHYNANNRSWIDANSSIGKR